MSEVLSTLNAQNPPLPDLPPQPEGSHRKRTIDEEEELLLAQSARIETADRADAAREARERWRAQVMLVLDQVESALTQQHSVPDTTTTSASTPESDLKRKRSTRQSKGNLASMPLVPSQDIANPLQKIVLHRALLNSVDLFGSSGDLTLQDVMNDSALQSQLRKCEYTHSELPQNSLLTTGTRRTVPDTDVVGVQSLEGSTHLRQPAPTLGQISLPPHPPPAGARDLSRQPDPKPVLNLYFDPFSSFAPTYDSTDANLSYTASAHWSSSQEQAVAWQKESLLAKVYAEDVEASKQAASLQVKEKPTELESLDMNVDEALASHLGLESKAQLEQLLLYAPSSHDGATDATLRSISTALLDLQLGQLDRLRRSALQLRVLPTSAMHATNGQPTSVKLSELEAAQAAEVLEKLTQLAAAVRPKDLTPPSSKDPSSSSLARALKAPLLEAKDDRATPPPSFSGTLPPAQQATVLRESLLTVSAGRKTANVLFQQQS